ncbi:methionine-rich copper-binding protein CopC [Desulfitispora alkaliphila]|uniref:Ig-like domain-containing protein n=1 Tax=Desulfitispora alkaliphila TaxID=622674 RepID=UPI003D1DFE57
MQKINWSRILLFTLLFLFAITPHVLASDAGTGPTIVNSNPEDNESMFPVDGEITIQFSDNMNRRTLNTSNIYIKKSGADERDSIRVNLSSTSNGRTVTLAPRRNLDYDTVYAIHIKDQVQDVHGNSIEPIRYTFATIDRDRAFISSQYPAPDEDDFPVGESITVRFSRDMDGDTIDEDSVYLRSAGSMRNIPATVRYSDSNRTITLSPRSSLDYSTTYNVYLTDQIRDSRRNRIERIQWQFTTKEEEYEASIEMQPDSGAENIPVDSVITVNFVANMDVRSFNTNNIHLRKIGAPNSVPLKIQYTSSGRTLYLTPKAPLAYDTRYRVTLSTHIRELAGSHIPMQTWEFATENPGREFLFQVSPLPWESNVSVNQGIAITFDQEEVNTSLFNTENVYVKNRYTNARVPVSIYYMAANNTLHIKPVNRWNYNSTYDVHLSDRLLNQQGSMLQPGYWTFSTPASYGGVLYSSPNIFLNNRALDFPDTRPVVLGQGHTLVTLRPVMEALGAEFGAKSLDSGEMQIWVRYWDTELVFHQNSPVVYENGNKKDLPIATSIVNGRTLIPLRYMVEALDLRVEWDRNLQSIRIYNY